MESRKIVDRAFAGEWQMAPGSLQVLEGRSLPKVRPEFENSSISKEETTGSQGSWRGVGALQDHSLHGVVSQRMKPDHQYTRHVSNDPFLVGVLERHHWQINPVWNLFCYPGKDKENVFQLDGKLEKSTIFEKENYRKEDLATWQGSNGEMSHFPTYKTEFSQISRALVQPRNLEIPNHNLTDSAVSELQKPSLFIKISNLNPNLLNHKVVVNLLCCFGNIGRVLLRKSEATVIASFRNKKDAARALAHLNGQVFFGSRLGVEFFQPSGSLGASIGLSIPGYDVYQCQSADFRYKCSLRIKFNAPTTVLHVANLSESVTPKMVFEIMRTLHEPIKIILLAQRGANDTMMMLIQFRSISESSDVLALLHNKILDQKALRISFSHSCVDCE
jgi:hypothetical protein